MRTYIEFYQSVILPTWAPPSWVFGVAWSVIYPLLVAATVYLAFLVRRHRAPRIVFWVLLANWVANLFFTPIQLGLRPLWPASLDILAVLGTLAYVEYRIRKYSPLVAWLLAPYLAWGIFATVLQLTIMVRN